MTMIQAIPLLLVLAVAVVNVATLLLWYLLLRLVRSSDPLIGAETGATYTRYLFGKLLEGGVFPVSRMQSIGNPDRDQIIRKVKGSQGYAIIAGVVLRLKHAPLNFVPLMFR